MISFKLRVTKLGNISGSTDFYFYREEIQKRNRFFKTSELEKAKMRARIYPLLATALATVHNCLCTMKDGLQGAQGLKLLLKWVESGYGRLRLGEKERVW